MGVHAQRVTREHYFVAVTPQNPEDDLQITTLKPAVHTLGAVEPGELTYVDRNVTLDAVSESASGPKMPQRSLPKRATWEA